MDFSKITDIGIRIHEQRKMEAAKANLLGQNGKLGMILKYLGDPILGQDCGNRYSQPLYDVDGFYSQGSEDALPVMDDDEESYLEGYSYYGLKNGHDLQIKYLSENQSLSVHFRSYKVFEEVENQLTCYIPSEIWENEVDKLYNAAVKKQKASRKGILIEKKEQQASVKNKMLNWLKNAWGVEFD